MRTYPDDFTEASFQVNMALLTCSSVLQSNQKCLTYIPMFLLMLKVSVPEFIKLNIEAVKGTRTTLNTYLLKFVFLLIPLIYKIEK